MKRLISLLLVFMLLLGGASFAEEPAGETAAETDETFEEFEDVEDGSGEGADGDAEGIAYLVDYDYDRLTVGNPNPMNGKFFTGLWGNNTSDIDVRKLVTGYSLVTWDGDLGSYRFDHSVVTGAVIGDETDGSRRYLISLYDDLTFSDGTPVTAWDYAFSVLLQASPLIRELGGTPARYDYLLGYEEYASGKTNTLAGLRVVDDHKLVFAVRKEALPYFYELARFDVSPYPISTIAPGCQVFDSEDGAYIGNANPAEKETLFAAKLLRETILTPDTGYLVHPVPGSGPYIMESFDGETASFALNPWYKGNEEGNRPRIQNLIYTHADNENMIQALGEGQFALLNKVTMEEAIRTGLELCTTRNQFTRAIYPRAGQNFLCFNPESSAVQSLPVRQAIAHAFDRKSFIQTYVGYYGLVADGMYGLGQWMYQLAAGTMLPPVAEPETDTAEARTSYEAALAEWEEISLDGLTTYDLDLDQAETELQAAGYVYNESGEAYRPGIDTQRYRQGDSMLESLTLTIAYPEQQEVDAPLKAYLADHLQELGIGVKLLPVNMAFLEAFFEETSPDQEIPADSFDLLYVGNNYDSAFDPSIVFRAGKASSEEELAEKPESLPAIHAEMRKLARDMDATEPTDILGYMRKWLLFQERLSEALPILPVYINVYFDFYTREMNQYWIAEHTNWADAIVNVRMGRSDEMTADDLNEIAGDYQNAAGGTAASGASDFKTTRRTNESDSTGDGALSSFPKSVRDQIPPEYRAVNEFITATIGEGYQNVKSATLQFGFETKYPAGETVYLLFGVMQGSAVDWIVAQAVVLEDGSVSVSLTREQLDRLSSRSFPLVVVSKE